MQPSNLLVVDLSRIKSNRIIYLFHKLRNMSQLGKYCWLSTPFLHLIAFSFTIKKSSKFYTANKLFENDMKTRAGWQREQDSPALLQQSQLVWNAGWWGAWLTEPDLTWCEGQGLQADETPLEMCPVETQNGMSMVSCQRFREWVQKHLL